MLGMWKASRILMRGSAYREVQIMVKTVGTTQEALRESYGRFPLSGLLRQSTFGYRYEYMKRRLPVRYPKIPGRSPLYESARAE